MPFIPHTENDLQTMLATIGVDSVDDLFSEIPKSIPVAELMAIPTAMNEMEVSRLMRECAAKIDPQHCFIGAGAYQHYIPAAVWEITGRGEYLTAYTPYQAEASQGSLQLFYEYQTMMAQLTAMEVSNASLYDGATALAEAMLMAVRIKRHKANRILVPATLHPHYRQVLNVYAKIQQIELQEIPYCPQQGRIDVEQLQTIDIDNVAALIMVQPNFFGVLEQVDDLADWAAAHNILTIALVNPIAMALLKPPGQWGEHGADIVCGEGQPLGVPMSGGGPYFGFLCTRQKLVREMPGRIVGKTTDQQGQTGYTLTLQAREQHIRRAKAKSNICTNQGLLVTAATIYMSLLGAEGLREVAEASHANTHKLLAALQALPGIHRAFPSPYFHEVVLQFDASAEKILASMQNAGIQSGLLLEPYYPELKNSLLVCVTEVKTVQDITHYAQSMAAVLENCEVADV